MVQGIPKKVHLVCGAFLSFRHVVVERIRGEASVRELGRAGTRRRGLFKHPQNAIIFPTGDKKYPLRYFYLL
jgi:hypothetical protein